MGNCWAYGPTGARCEKNAGHDGLHSVSTEWSDDECFTPQQTRPVVLRRRDPEPSEYEPSADEECLVCDHPMHLRLCPVGECDCRAGIPK